MSQAEAEGLASQHAREAQRLRRSLQEAQQALAHAQDGQAAAEMQAEEEVRVLKQQHEQLTLKLEARHKQQMQVLAALAALSTAFWFWPAWLNRLTWPNHHPALRVPGVLVRSIRCHPQDEYPDMTAYPGT